MRNDEHLEIIRLRTEAARAKRGQFMAFTLVLFGFGLIAFAIERGSTAIGVSVSATLLVAVVGGFLAAAKPSRNNHNN